MLEEDDGRSECLAPQFVHQSALFAQSVGVVALRHNHHVVVVAQACFHLLVQVEVSEEEEFGLRLTHGQQRQRTFRKGGECALLALPCVGVDHVAYVFASLCCCGQLAGAVHVVGEHVAKGRVLVGAERHHHGHLAAAHVEHGLRRSAFGVFVAKVGCCLGWNGVVTGALHHIRGQFVGHRNFRLGSLAQAHPQRVAYAVGQQGAYAHGTLDASVFTLAGLRHAQVQREAHALAFHHLAEQTHGAHHHLRVRGFDAYHHVGEMLLHAYPQKLHAALYDACGCVAVAAHDAVRQRTVVYAYAQRRAVLPAYRQQTAEAFLQACQFGGILLVGVFELLELPGGVGVVAGVDAHLLHDGCGHVGHVGVKVHVGHERAVVSHAA